ncbi:MAG TPA: hypothetical protein P5301_00075 [Bacteroidales bacterium]|nr:hypothetical protein [Bacteroidales bacterium]HRR51859.1 hypothetical protein [Bacteroidales bacterium]HRS68563.1 hypothetical protein [Bacteroidales bacterium]
MVVVIFDFLIGELNLAMANKLLLLSYNPIDDIKVVSIPYFNVLSSL